MANYKIKVPANVKFTIDPGKDFRLIQKIDRPDVLSIFESSEQFKNWVPEIEFNPDTKQLYVTNLTQLGNWLIQGIELYTSEKGYFEVPFTDKRLFQVGLIVTKYHRSPRINNKRKIKRLTPWQDDNGRLRPYGAAVCWGGFSFSPEIKVKIRVKNWITGEIDGFPNAITLIHPKQKEIDKNMNAYYFGVIFRVRDPYTGKFITTKPSRECICRLRDYAGESDTYYFKG